MRAKEANQRSEAETTETKHDGELWQNTGGDNSCYVADFKFAQRFACSTALGSPRSGLARSEEIKACPPTLKRSSTKSGCA